MNTSDTPTSASTADSTTIQSEGEPESSTNRTTGKLSDGILGFIKSIFTLDIDNRILFPAIGVLVKLQMEKKLEDERRERRRRRKRKHRKALKKKRAQQKAVTQVKQNPELQKALTDFLDMQTQTLGSQYDDIESKRSTGTGKSGGLAAL
ncbi:hypothetical protein Q1695_009067 [Nippostrongylus brasiliensis]|nr:hypothetical protein Q1695_009067 [Nippostrongylus brasiliensis]